MRSIILLLLVVALGHSQENAARQFAQDYIAQVNKENWVDGIEKYLQDGSDAFIREFTAFRNSFPNYKITIKRMFVEGNEVMLWLKVTANYVEDFKFRDSSYGGQLLLDFKAENQALDWDEVWYFDVVDRKFGAKWDMLKDHYTVLQGLQGEE